MSIRRPIREDLFSEQNSSVKLLCNQCNSCGQKFFPKISSFCLKCLSNDLADVELKAIGSLHSFSTSWIGTKNYEPPYTTGFVDLGAGVRLFAQLDKDTDPESLKTGMLVDLIIDDLWSDGNETVFGYRFTPTSK